MRDRGLGRRLTMLGVAVLVAVAGLLAGPVPARAEDPVQVMLLLDVSGSMNEKIASGGTRLDSAKTALKQVADALPAGTPVGLRVYGSKIKEPKEENPKACQDTDLVMPLGPLDRNRMHAAVDSFRAVGETPIAYTLEQSVKDFTGTGRRVVVLVSDGEENCVPDPCPVAKKLAASGVELQFNAIGFNVNGKARKQLKCIVDQTDGSYYDAEDTEDLTDSLEKLTQRALRPFSLSGAPVKATTDRDSAPLIRAGQYLDRYDATGDPRYYRIDRTPGSTLSIGVSSILKLAADGNSDSWELTLETPDGSLCDSDTFGGGAVVSTAVQSGSVTSAGGREECQSGPMVLKVRRAPWSKQDLRIELAVFEEPPITNTAELPPPVTKVSAAGPVDRQKGPAKVVGGLAFNDAPVLKPGSYLDELAVGETVVYRVALQPGQRLRATLDAPRPGSDWQLGSGYEGVVPRVIVLSPTRAEIDNRYAALMGGTPSVRVTAGTPEIRVRNREAPDPTAGDNALRAASVGGDYFLAVSLDANRTNLLRTLLPVQLNVAVDGEPAGLPVYQATTPTPSASPPSSPTGTGTDPASPDPSASSETPGQPGDGTPSLGDAGVAVAVIVGVLIVAGAIAVLVLRRLRRSRSD
jgi:Ca-activated chloride channel family protein